MNTQIHTFRYVMRRRLVLQVAHRFPADTFAEIGCGRGELMPWLARMGYCGVGVEISEPARRIAKRSIADFEPCLNVVDSVDRLRGRSFRYIFALEVLEHIENDGEALSEWCEHLEDGGKVIITVPAHMKYWTRADDAGGHYRRYSRDQLGALFKQCGLQLEFCWSYGYPLVAVTRRLRNLAYRDETMDSRTMSERTLASSFDSTRNLGRLTPFVNPVTEGVGYVGHLLQQYWLRSDRGDGYLAVASCG